MTPSLLLLLLQLLLPRASSAAASWHLLLPNIGISAMHMQLLHTDRVVIFDRTDFGASNISLPAGRCRDDPNDTALTQDCTAHSVEYDVASNSVRPLTVLTDTWCSSGAVLPDGTLLQTGGYNDGDHAVRMYTPCRDKSCDWRETNPGLTQRRWYATNQILPDGRQIIVGGRRQFNYEFYPKTTDTTSYNLPFLVQTNDPRIENNLYPFVFLNTDGNLFIFANNRAILFDYSNKKVVKNYPAIPGGDPRSYPSSGSAVLLPLQNPSGAEVLVCGGAPKGSYLSANNGNFVPALRTCGRIRIDDPNPQWAMETMPGPRVMGDMVLLPDATVLIINGAESGTAGWEFGHNPVLSPVIYNPINPIGSRFEIESPTTTPRMYHSTAILLRDGRVLVGGSNPHTYYNFTGVEFPTDLTLESFSPSYMENSSIRPRIIYPASQSRIGYRQRLKIGFSVAATGQVNVGSVTVTMVAPSFTTHSFSMNQRVLVLLRGGKGRAVGKAYETEVMSPETGNFAPPGYYLVFVVHGGVASEGIWVQLK